MLVPIDAELKRSEETQKPWQCGAQDPSQHNKSHHNGLALSWPENESNYLGQAS